MEKAKLNAYSTTTEYESPRPIKIGDVFYQIVEVDKDVPSTKDKNEMYYSLRLFVVKVEVQGIKKLLGENRLWIWLRAGNDCTSKFYIDDWTPTDNENFQRVDEAFEEWVEREDAEWKQSFPDEDRKFWQAHLWRKLFTSEEKARSFAKAYNTEYKNWWNAECDADSLPTWEKIWEEAENESENARLVAEQNECALEYKGYHTYIHYSAADKILYGKIEDIKDLVDFESESAVEIENEFHKAVDDYIAFCKEVGKGVEEEKGE